jgi:flavin-dependent dehydrogenase
MFWVKVAIIGAGVSGLSCAIELERHGESPVIYDKKSFLWDAYDLNAWVFKDWKQGQDSIRYVREKFHIDLIPKHGIQRIIRYENGKEKVFTGNFGVILKRGMEKESLGNQLAKMLSGKVHLETYVYDVDELIHAYDKIIVATGNHNIAKSLQIWTPISSYRVKIATVVGEFDPGTLIFWKDPNFCKDGFAYMIANRFKEANVTLQVNDVSYSEMQYYWKKFLSLSGFDFKIIETKDIDFHRGRLEYSAEEGKDFRDKIFFIGNARAQKGDFLGDGIVESIESGVQTARKILRMESI